MYDIGPSSNDFGRPQRNLRCVVCIPARDEAARIGACLDALSSQLDDDGVPLKAGMVRVLLLVNNTTDDTVAVARTRADDGRIDLEILEALLSPGDANAGTARRIVMDAGADRLDQAGSAEGVILTTDADTCVPPDWIARNLAAVDAGADAVAGSLRLDPADEAALPAALKWRGAREGRYERRICELETLIDPRPCDPWPRHPTAAGASLAVTLRSYRAIGGLPRCAFGEDRALVEALERIDRPVRHAPDIAVVTSGRLDGRAIGGVADTIRFRIATPDAPCDPYLEPLWIAVLRFAARRYIRTRIRTAPIASGWRVLLRLPTGAATDVAQAPTAGGAIEILEERSPVLARRPLRPNALARHSAMADVVLWVLRGLKPTTTRSMPKRVAPIGSQREIA